jgi:hypothetical protein
LRRVMFLLSLVAALTGTPLRLAEAAHDIACALAESGGGDALEVPDGRVGDDSDATIKPDNILVCVALSFAVAIVFCTFLASQASWRALPQRADRPPRLIAGRSQRLALLQCFLC